MPALRLDKHTHHGTHGCKTTTHTCKSLAWLRMPMPWRRRHKDGPRRKPRVAGLLCWRLCNLLLNLLLLCVACSQIAMLRTSTRYTHHGTQSQRMQNHTHMQQQLGLAAASACAMAAAAQERSPMAAAEEAKSGWTAVLEALQPPPWSPPPSSHSPQPGCSARGSVMGSPPPGWHQPSDGAVVGRSATGCGGAVEVAPYRPSHLAPHRPRGCGGGDASEAAAAACDGLMPMMPWLHKSETNLAGMECIGQGVQRRPNCDHKHNIHVHMRINGTRHARQILERTTASN